METVETPNSFYWGVEVGRVQMSHKPDLTGLNLKYIV